MQPARPINTTIVTLEPQLMEANEQMDNPEPVFCQVQYLGRTVSMSKKQALSHASCLPVCLSTALSFYCIDPSILCGLGSLAVGTFMGTWAGSVAESVYPCLCRNVTATAPSLHLSMVTSHTPEATGKLTETFCEEGPIDFPATFRHPPEPPPAYTPGELPAYPLGELPAYTSRELPPPPY